VRKNKLLKLGADPLSLNG
jgi:hypothetical protein